MSADKGVAKRIERACPQIAEDHAERGQGQEGELAGCHRGAGSGHKHPECQPAPGNGVPSGRYTNSSIAQGTISLHTTQA